MGIRLDVIQEQLRAQQDLSVVERFSRLHDEGNIQEGSLYESQIPLSKPQDGQQYGFQVDLDACTGCKACVVGCNKLNGLDHDEAWRAVGVLHGGTKQAPIQQTVTTACHHCLDPACMNGCPVGAYEKNPETGIVKHLDDQCIGCQYCTLTCPYEVPQYNDRLGIVRKCDMCQDRLEDGESPACVESCPNGAISIEIVQIDQIRTESKGDGFLPRAPTPSITQPTTRYVTEREVPVDVLAGNSHSLRPAHAHGPLAVMLVLTQLSIGAFAWDFWLSPQRIAGPTAQQVNSLVALVVGVMGLGAATLHLGRPLYAFRAFLGLRTSWMSREIVAGGAFVKLAVVYTLTLFKPEWFEAIGLPSLLSTDMGTISRILGGATALLGAFAGFCSIMIYVVTKKEWWNALLTSSKFIGTAALLGLSTWIASASGALVVQGTENESTLRILLFFVMAITATKLIGEASLLGHADDEGFGELKRSALLLSHQLRSLNVVRFLFGALGGLILPGLIIGQTFLSSQDIAILSILSLLSLLIGELLERFGYFMAVSSTQMPGSVGK